MHSTAWFWYHAAVTAYVHELRILTRHFQTLLVFATKHVTARPDDDELRDAVETLSDVHQLVTIMHVPAVGADLHTATLAMMIAWMAAFQVWLDTGSLAPFRDLVQDARDAEHEVLSEFVALDIDWLFVSSA